MSVRTDGLIKDMWTRLLRLNNIKCLFQKHLGQVNWIVLFSDPLLGKPFVGCTQSFLTFGGFDTETEAEACLRYVKTKFARALLYVFKRTHNMTSGSWRCVPL